VPALSIFTHLVLGAVFLSFAGNAVLLEEMPKIRPAHLPEQIESVIYFGPDLPEIQDSDGAAAGVEGRSGSQQTRAAELIKVARAPIIKSTTADPRPPWLPPSANPAANFVLLLPPPVQPIAPVIPRPVVSLTTTTDQPLRTIKRVEVLRAVAVPKLKADSKREAFPLNIATPAVAPALAAAAVAAPKLPEVPAQVTHPVTIAPPVPVAVPEPHEAPPSSVAFEGKSAPIKIEPAPKAPTPVLVAESVPAIHDDVPTVPNGSILVAVSPSPSSKIEIPPGQAGTVALSPSASKTAAPEAGIGTTSRQEPSTGVALAGSGSGRATSHAGFGSSGIVIAGMAPGPDAGGTGDRLRPSTGITISRSEVYLPSFSGMHDPSTPSRGPGETKLRSGVIVVATDRSGGGLDPRFAPHGARVYTIYLQASGENTVMQFADRAGNPGELTPPTPISIEIPSDLKLAHVVIGFLLDSTGKVRDLHVLQAQDNALVSRLMAALSHWLFRPAVRGDQPLAVNAVIGFGVNTN
jgi:hypothetical protein